MNKLGAKLVKTLIFIGLGIALGAYLFADTQPRDFLDIKNCQTDCLRPNELLGLLTSFGIQKFPQGVPKVIKETDKTIVVPHPFPETPIHYLVVPKKDIKNIGEITADDQEYIMDSLAVIRAIVAEKELSNYQVITNGPGQQQVTYLHFHLMAQDKE